MKRFLALKASAGSGKTYALTVRYISLILNGAKANEILALTFTNKAANEMKQRIVSTLFDLEDKQAYLDSICLELNLSQEEVLNRKNSVCDDFLSNEINILTIDKFINKILREFSGYAGVGDDYKIKTLNTEYFIYRFLRFLDDEQLQNLIEFIYAHGRKLDSIIDILRFMDEKNEPIICQEVEYNVVTSLKDEILRIALKLKILLVSDDKISDSGKKALDFDDFDILLLRGKTWLTKDKIEDFTYFKKIATPEANKIFWQLKIKLKDFYVYDGVFKLGQISKIYGYFKIFKEEFSNFNNSFEFGDVTNRVYKLLSGVIDKEFLYFRLDTKFSHLLIDEFQDTSLLQYQILKPLISEIVAGDSYEYKTLFYVGDTKQAIYRFRNGKKELFDSIANEFKNINIEILSTNYRSAKKIVDFVNLVFEKIPDYEYYPQKSNIDIDGFVKIGISKENDHLNHLLEDVKYLIANNISSEQIAILTFTNDEIFEIFEYFKENAPDIKLSTEMTNLLINQRNVKAIINLIKYYYFENVIYARNFNALVGDDFFHEISIKKDFSDIKKMVFDIAFGYKIFDENVAKFIEILGEYQDIVDFVLEIDLCDTAMQNSEKSGITVMTIFKAKGLEWDNVILLDRFKQKSNFSVPILYDYDGAKLNQVFYKATNREIFDEEYKIALENEKRLAQNDLLNLLYVALTRAKYNLLVIKAPKNSTFDILSLDECCIGSLFWQVTKTKKEAINIINTPSPKVPVQKIKPNKEVKESNLYGEYFGLATHLTLQMMSNFDVQSIQKALIFTKSKYYQHINETDFETLKQIIELFVEDERFVAILQKSKFTLKEQPLIYNGEHKIIDLYIDCEDFGVVCDYKTGAKADIYSYQVGFYKQALSNILNKPILGFVVYLGQIIEFIEVN